MVIVNKILSLNPPIRGSIGVHEFVEEANKSGIKSQSPYKGFNSWQLGILQRVELSQSPYKGFNRNKNKKKIMD